ncbi:MAG: aspartyl protease family protein [Acidobacteria bacterium]|nr:aspartyl protease family protein [Acidobacteriota bacterium]
MRLFEVSVTVANPATPQRTRQVSLVVDTGATLTFLPGQLLTDLGVAPTSRLEFELADGRTLERDIGGVLLSVNGRTVPVPVAFAEPGEATVLGATALEAMGFAVDPVGKKLVPRKLLFLRISSL